MTGLTKFCLLNFALVNISSEFYLLLVRKRRAVASSRKRRAAPERGSEQGKGAFDKENCKI